MEITGGCLCRAVRFQISAPPLVTRICWCRLCQYLASGNATVNTCFPKDAVNFTGALRDYTCTADSGNVMHRRFCPLCGTQVFTTSEARPTLIFVRAGTLDDPTVAQPSVTIWTSQAPRWACIDADLPRVARQPPPLP
ncbi:MAG: GFA family protein [Pseudomonadota bacterium]|nr:GFA family protein [Pseudomonadota bacterium]